MLVKGVLVSGDVSRCPADSQPVAVQRTLRQAWSACLTTRLEKAHCWKHGQDLLIRYTGVSGFAIDPADEGRGTDLGAVMLDEILPHKDGCSHEITCWDGTLTVVCRDLQATWTETICSSQPYTQQVLETVERLVPKAPARPQGGNPRQHGDLKTLTAVTSVATYSRTWQQLPTAAFGPPRATNLAGSSSVRRPGCGPNFTVCRSTGSAPEASWTDRAARSTR
ncbi:hypothetical protein ACFUGD_28395 [Streptomyces sp. NPDC057217]|uniref:hypothetical protein n=1 Tax=Streptomyces sp. NPDC057217 TaxID=3346054 RepID=UPI003644154A